MSLSLIRFTTCLWSRAVCACLATVVLCESPVAAQSQRPEQKTETKTATVVEVQQKGRGRTLVVDDGAGQQSEYPLTPRIALEVTGRGDAGFVRAGQFLSAKGTMTNNKLFLKELTIHVAKRGTRLPAGRFAKAPPQEGDSTESYLVSGAIVASQADKDYPDYLLVGLKLPGQIPPILLEPGFVVTVVSNDPDLIPVGAPVDLELAPLRGGRFNLVRATVRVAEELQVEKVLGGGPPESESPAPAKAVPDAAAAPAKEPGAE